MKFLVSIFAWRCRCSPTNGRKLFLGSSGPGEPPPDAAPLDKAKP